MSNTIRLNHNSPVSQWITMSNGLTSVFINVIGLSGSRLAKTEEEKRMIIWILEKNQSVLGLGTAGFEVCEMPWNVLLFDENKGFMMSVISGVKRKLGWETLLYHPNEDLLFPCIEQFEQVIQQMEAGQVDEQSAREWLDACSDEDPVLHGFPMCPVHQALLTVFGCQICMD